MSADPTWEVPKHETHEFAPKRTRFCVAIPIINEGERIHRQLARMKPVLPLADVVIADGGSTDGATDHLRLTQAGVRTLLVKTDTGRLGAQLRMAFAWAMAQGYEGVILIDGNDKDDPAAIADFVQALEDGWDFVQGSRFLPGGQAINNPKHRLAALKLIHAPAVSLASRRRFTDTTNGFRAYSARLLRDPRVAPFRAVFQGYEYHYYLAIRAARLGLRVKEIAVTREYPKGEPTPTKISFFRGNLKVLEALGRACLGLYDPR